MKLDFLTVNGIAGRQLGDPMERPAALAAAVALTVARRIPVPSSEVEDPEQYYILTVLPQVRSYLSDANEAMLLDLNKALDVAKMIWMVRVTAAFPQTKRSLNPIYGFFDTIVGTGNFVDNETHEMVNKYKTQILMLADEIEKVFKACDEKKGA